MRLIILRLHLSLLRPRVIRHQEKKNSRFSEQFFSRSPCLHSQRSSVKINMRRYRKNRLRSRNGGANLFRSVIRPVGRGGGSVQPAGWELCQGQLQGFVSSGLPGRWGPQLLVRTRRASSVSIGSQKLNKDVY